MLKIVQPSPVMMNDDKAAVPVPSTAKKEMMMYIFSLVQFPALYHAGKSKMKLLLWLALRLAQDDDDQVQDEDYPDP